MEESGWKKGDIGKVEVQVNEKDRRERRSQAGGGR